MPAGEFPSQSSYDEPKNSLAGLAESWFDRAAVKENGNEIRLAVSEEGETTALFFDVVSPGFFRRAIARGRRVKPRVVYKQRRTEQVWPPQ